MHEALALQHWHGDGTVRLLRADPHRRALLLERLDRRDLHRGVGPRGVRDRGRALPADPPCRPCRSCATVTSYVDAVARRRWPGSPQRHPDPAPDGRAGARRSAATWSPTRPASDGSSTATCTTRTSWPRRPARPEPGQWLVIDPKPMSGDPHYELAPMLWNRYDEYAGDVRDGVRRRFHALVDARRARRGPRPRLGRRPDGAQRQLVDAGRRARRPRRSTPRSGSGSPGASRSPRRSRTELAAALDVVGHSGDTEGAQEERVTFDPVVIDKRPRSLAHMFLDRVETTPDADAYYYPVDGGWQESTWGQTHALVEGLAAGLVALGDRARGAGRDHRVDPLRVGAGVPGDRCGPAVPSPSIPRRRRRQVAAPAGRLGCARGHRRGLRHGATPCGGSARGSAT